MCIRDRRYLIYTALFIPVALLYMVLEHYCGESWPTVGPFVVLLASRIALQLYRPRKGIHDSWLDGGPRAGMAPSPHALTQVPCT